jgi:hypothetical protein
LAVKKMSEAFFWTARFRYGSSFWNGCAAAAAAGAGVLS